jgi:hypothetical protein
MHLTNYLSLTIVLAIEQVGVETMDKDSKLDDDVSLHPGSIGALAREMERNPEVCLKNSKSGLAAVNNSTQSAHRWQLDRNQTVQLAYQRKKTVQLH